MALHEQSVGKSDNWFTPSFVFEALGCTFDVDVASPGQHVTPWIPAKEFITANSLLKEWNGFVWMNPPFGGRMAIVPWLEKFVQHGNGIGLVPDRTSCPWWQAYAPRMDLIVFVAPKIKFLDAFGRPGPSPAQGTCLMAFAKQAREALIRGSSLGVLMRSP